jgi:hypothetical protein
MTDLRNGRKQRVGQSRCDDVLAEPFDDATLVKTVGRLLRGGRTAPRRDDA